jgi:hypothetical protein
MYNKTRLLACGKSLVGFREDNNSIYDDLYKVAQASEGSGMAFAASGKTITWTGGNFEDEGFIIGDSITITLSTSNNGVKTIAAIADNVITTTETLTDESSTTSKIRALGDLQKSTSGINFNDLSAVNFEMIEANLSSDILADDYLTNIYESEFLSLIDQFVNKTKQNYNSKELLARQSITAGVASMNNLVVQNQRFVGYWLRPHRSNYLRTQIIELGFQGSEIQSNLKVYLYETSQLEPVKTFTFNISKAKSLTWATIEDAILSYQSETGGTGQEYLLGYYEKDLNNPQAYQLQGQALYMDFDCNCPGSPKELYGKYLGIHPIEINNANLNWDPDEEEYFIPQVDNLSDFVSSQTYGLVAKINTTCDITDVICQNIGMFARPLQHAVASRILFDAYASTRINSISDSKRDQAKSFAVKYSGVLNGYTTPEGIKIKGLIDTLTVDFSELDSYCLPCSPGITRGRLVR